MRTNLPVTQIEYPLLDGLSIVSKTDLKGRITYINPYFIEVSGFSEEELIGSPHNLVRHPDMPPEAFADLWRTLKAGLPWTGMVKNRRKNGDYYWVLANVTPVREGDRVVGYMSVRTKPTREQVEAATELYAKMRAGRATGVRLHHGALLRTGLAGKLQALANMSFGKRFGLLSALVGALVVALGAVAIMQPGQQGWILGLGAAALGVLSLFWYTLHASVVKPLKGAVQTARAVAGGDLSLSFDSNRHDDMGQLLNALQQMNVNLKAIIGDVRANVETITTGTRDIAAGNHGLSARTEMQTANLQRTASSMEELASAVKQNASNAASAHQLGLEASGVAERGGHVVQQVVHTMSEISTASRRVVEIVGIIDSIAFQTNILALNAAVEAARAGEQGKGFAVVAAEVRQLAQRCAVAAKDIKELIDQSAQKVDSGTTLVQQAGATMEEIVASVKNVAELMSEISIASSEQDAGISQVNLAMAEMDQATQQNAVMVGEATMAAETLADQAVRLAQTIAMFRLSREENVATVTAPVQPKLPRAEKPLLTR